MRELKQRLIKTRSAIQQRVVDQLRDRKQCVCEEQQPPPPYLLATMAVCRKWQCSTMLSTRAVFKGLYGFNPSPKMLEKNSFALWKICNATYERWPPPSATILTYFAAVDLVAGAWPDAFEIPSVYKCTKTLGSRGSTLDPTEGAYSAPLYP